MSEDDDSVTTVNKLEEPAIETENRQGPDNSNVVVGGRSVLDRYEANIPSADLEIDEKLQSTSDEDVQPQVRNKRSIRHNSYPAPSSSKKNGCIRSHSFDQSVPARNWSLMRNLSSSIPNWDFGPPVIKTTYKKRNQTMIHKKVKVCRDRISQGPTPNLRAFWNLSTRWSQSTSKSIDSKIPPEVTQYRITSKTKVEHKSSFQRFKSFAFGNQNIESSLNFVHAIGDRRSSFIFDINASLVRFLVFSYKTSFTTLFFSLLFIYFSLIIIFSLCMWGVGTFDEKCFEPELGINNTHFIDAFALSWTTFTTVGYGNTNPKTEGGTCFIITFVCTIEAFVGVLWTGICGAIIFNKVVRLRSLASVIFSDPITIRYGSGLNTEVDDCEDILSNKMRCPVLTFRLANENFDQPGGEIIDAQLKLEVFGESIDNPPFARSSSISSCRETLNNKQKDLMQRGSNFVRSSVRRQLAINPRCHYDSLEIDTPENPYFKRTWIVQHTLNEMSPLVKPQIRNMIRRNGGFWPANTSYEDIRRSLSFDQIFVSLSGTSILSASTVYAQHMYDFFDINIGYEFVPVLYKGQYGNIMIDFESFNDVVEQYGGGGEPFESIENSDDED